MGASCKLIQATRAAVWVGIGLLVIIALAGCGQEVKPAQNTDVNVTDQIADFVKAVKGNLIFVEGGEYLMGDYGVEHGPEGLPYDADKDSKPLHKVQLTSYSVDKSKITNREFQFYLRYNGLALRQDISSRMFKIFSQPENNPAHMDWYEAEKYCKWLMDVSGLPFALPTEAQWEYAARSRGQFFMVATDDGTYKVAPERIPGEHGLRGVNISSEWDREAFAVKMGWGTEGLTALPVDQFPPNPLGLYSMSDNGLEWVHDWYDPEYYKYSPLKDPQGPDYPSFKNYFGQHAKVMRGQSLADPAWGGGVNVHRTAVEPHGHDWGDGVPYLSFKTARCVVNSPSPVI
jgi:formylglycine-generating enzyme required for sulfatase activity